MELNLTQKQVQTLSPQMMQSMEILQMGSQELLEYIEEAGQENPVLEPEETYDKQDEFSVLRRKLEWLESTDPQNRYYHQQDTEEEDSPLNNFGTVQDDDENLYYYVLSQLRVLELEPEVMDAGVFLVESLNQNGWLDEPLEALAAGHGCGPEVMAQALEVVQSLEPAGVGARDLAECLKLQLVRRTPVNELAVRIVERHLDALSKSRYGLIARELKASPEEVRAACDVIRSLNPRPGTGFAARENLTYINPDIIVVSFPDHFELLTNDYYFPTLNISGYYTRLMKESDDSQVKDYLTGKVRQAKWMVKAIEQRRSTLMACAECILEFQESFFRKGPGHLVPLSLADGTEAIVAGFRYAFGRMGLPEPTEEAIRPTIGMVLEDEFTFLSGEADPARRAEFRQLYTEKAGPMHVSVTRLFPGALELLTALKRRGIPTGIVSTKKTATIRDVAEARGITPLLSSILGGDQVSAPKPDPEGLLASLTALGLEPHEVLFCGDTVIDGEAARRAGTHFCAVLNGTTTFEEFQTRRIPCDHVAGDLWDLKQWLGLN